MTDADLKDCCFTRSPADVPGYTAIMLRVPEHPDTPLTSFMLTGTEASAHIVEFHLASAAGILESLGHGRVARALETIGQQFAERIKDAREEAHKNQS